MAPTRSSCASATLKPPGTLKGCTVPVRCPSRYCPMTQPYDPAMSTPVTAPRFAQHPFQAPGPSRNRGAVWSHRLVRHTTANRAQTQCGARNPRARALCARASGFAHGPARACARTLTRTRVCARACGVRTPSAAARSRVRGTYRAQAEHGMLRCSCGTGSLKHAAVRPAARSSRSLRLPGTGGSEYLQVLKPN